MDVVVGQSVQWQVKGGLAREKEKKETEKKERRKTLTERRERRREKESHTPSE